jgi:hypothetical protein
LAAKARQVGSPHALRFAPGSSLNKNIQVFQPSFLLIARLDIVPVVISKVNEVLELVQHLRSFFPVPEFGNCNLAGYMAMLFPLMKIPPLGT